MADAVLETLIARRNAMLESGGAGSQLDAEHYKGVLQERADRYAVHVASMNLSPAIIAWSLQMERTYGPYVMAFHYVADWITALLILRYGEEPDAARSTDENYKGWPTSFPPSDIGRANELLQGVKFPHDKLKLIPRHLTEAAS